MLATALPAQDWRGQTRVSGSVSDLKGNALAGAAVQMYPPGPSEEGPPPVYTDDAGHWVIMGLAPGRWTIEIEAEGFITSRGWVDVPAAGVSDPVDVSLRDISEVTPNFSAGSPSTVLSWLEKGNSLLAQGRPAEARAEYEKALPQLSGDAATEVLRNVARTHFLENDIEGAIRALQQGLTLTPGDEASRQLLTELLAQQGREDEAREFLTDLDENPPPPAAEQVPGTVNGTDPILQPGFEPAAVEPGRPGKFRVAFAERSPWSSLELYRERLGVSQEEIDEYDPGGGRYDLAAERFDIYVPAAYNGSEPYGLLVWISPVDTGAFQSAELGEALDESKLIWVGAAGSGNRRYKWYRAALALDAAHNISTHYEIDEDRVYVAGYSGGGRVASSLAVVYPEVFRGGFFVFGCDSYRRIPLLDRPGAHWPAKYPPPPKATLREIKEDSRFVFLTGERDFNRAQTLATHRQFVEDGFAHATYLEVPGASHYELPGKEWLLRAFAALDLEP